MNNNLQELVESWLSSFEKEISFGHFPDFNINLGITKGIKRKNNQDRVVTCSIPNYDGGGKIICTILSDGMGGMKDGDKCANLTISSFISAMMKSGSPDLREKIINAIKEANDTVYFHYRGDGGATLSILVFDEKGKIYAFNVGDSRIYLLTSAGFIKQISIDDTLNGQLDLIENEKKKFEHYKQLLQFIGVGPELEPNEVIIDLNADFNGILLASDGINKIKRDVIELIIRHSLSGKDIVQRLIYLANWFGGEDNSSLIYIAPDCFNSSMSFKQVSDKYVNIYDAYQRFFSIAKSSEVQIIQKDNKTNEDNLTPNEKKKRSSKYQTRKKKDEIKKENKPQIEIQINTKEDNEG